MQILAKVSTLFELIVATLCQGSRSHMAPSVSVRPIHQNAKSVNQAVSLPQVFVRNCVFSQ